MLLIVTAQSCILIRSFPVHENLVTNHHFFFKLLNHSQKTLFNQFKLQKCQIRTYFQKTKQHVNCTNYQPLFFLLSHLNISKRPYFSICFLHRVCFKNWKIIIELKKSWLMHLCVLKNLAFFGCA